MKDDGLLSLELKIAVFLRIGVLVAGAFLLVGWLLQIQFTENPFLAFTHYQTMSLMDSLTEAVRHRSFALLISLPVTRVFLTAVLFLRRREFLMASIAMFVLVALTVSVMLGWEI